MVRASMLVMVGVMVALICLGASTSGAGQAPGAGVYSVSQARQGQIHYLHYCEACHGPDLLGDSGEEIPALTGDEFMGEWTGRSVKALYEKVSKTMPASEPGTLETQVYADLVAFLLQSNNIPPGAAPLIPGSEHLDRTIIEKPPR